MLWLLTSLLTLVILAPIIVLFFRSNPKAARQQRDSVLALNKEALNELEKAHERGSISDENYEASKRELYERFVHTEKTPLVKFESKKGKIVLGGTIILIPLFSILLYLSNGRPSLPPEPSARVAQENAADNAKIAGLIAKIKNVQKTLPNDPAVQRQGYVLLGNLELANGRFDDAIADLQQALNRGFDPQMAAQLGEVISMRDHRVSPPALKLFKEALAQTPQGAPWRKPLMARIAQGEHEEENP